jgi:hypothetical protein
MSLSDEEAILLPSSVTMLEAVRADITILHDPRCAELKTILEKLGVKVPKKIEAKVEVNIRIKFFPRTTASQIWTSATCRNSSCSWAVCEEFDKKEKHVLLLFLSKIMSQLDDFDQISRSQLMFS